MMPATCAVASASPLGNSRIPSAILTTSRRCHAIERGQQRVRPPVQIVLTDVSANRLEPLTTLAGFHGQGSLDRVGLALDVEGVDRQRPLAQLRMRACVFR